MGRAFELVCLRHQALIARHLGFEAVDYEVGPWFRSARKDLPGLQIDLAYDRADGVITLCEMKRQNAPIGRAIITEVERKATALRTAYPRRTIQPVLIADAPISRDLAASGYFTHILQGTDLLK